MESGAEAGRRIQSVLFMCAFNAVRSPMAEGITRYYFGRFLHIASAGVRSDKVDPFAVAVMEEMGIDIADHASQALEDLDDANFDLIITLSPEAHHQALELTRTQAVDVEYWPTLDPTGIEGPRDQRLEAYRAVRDALKARIIERFIF